MAFNKFSPSNWVKMTHAKYSAINEVGDGTHRPAKRRLGVDGVDCSASLAGTLRGEEKGAVMADRRGGKVKRQR
jgi:hypothetical protein